MLGSIIKTENWNGKAEYYKVVGTAKLDECRFAEGETYLSRGTGAEVPVAVPCFKNGKEKKYPAVRIECDYRIVS